MPLVIITGIPCSGKSQVAQNIAQHFKEKKVFLVQEQESLVSDKNETFNDSIAEKTLRSDVKSKVIRHLSKDNLVIFDGLNYIKGFRYELYCASKSVKTTQVTVHCDISPGTAWNWNLNREQKGKKFQ